MGNHPSQQVKEFRSLSRETQLTEGYLQNGEQDNEEEIKQSNCFCCKSAKTIEKKTTWRTKFIDNCQQIMEEYDWANALVQIVNDDNNENKGNYYREINQLKKKEKPQQQKQEVTAAEVEEFKKNLKKSFILSYGYGLSKNQSGKNSNLYKSTLRQSIIQIERQQKKLRCSILGVPKSIKRSSNEDCKRSFFQYDELMMSEEGENISKSITVELNSFMKFSNIIERHLNDPNCVIGTIKHSFIKFMVLRYRDHSKIMLEVDDFVKNIKVFLSLLKETVNDYYNLNSFGERAGKSPINTFISNADNILSTCTAILFRDLNFYNLVINCLSAYFKEQELRFNSITSKIKGYGPQKFTVKDKFCLNERTLKAYVRQMSYTSSQNNIIENIQIADNIDCMRVPYENCIKSLQEIVKSKSPVNKMKSIMQCSQGITKEIERFYEVNCLKKEKWMLDADQVLSIFAYIILHARISNLHAQLFILDSFATGHQMMAVTGYYLSVINCAVQYLENQYGGKEHSKREQQSLCQQQQKK